MKILKWLGIAVLAIVVVIACVGGYVYWAGGREVTRTETVVTAPLRIPTDSASIARGQHIGVAIGKCVGCHGDNLGGAMIIDAKPFMVLAAPNLTRGEGGVGAQLNDVDWVRVLRHGVAPNGRRLALMPSNDFTWFSDEDLAAVIAWARSRPPVSHAWAPARYGPIARMLLWAGKFPLYAYDMISHERKIVTAPATADSVAYGHYLVQVGGCYGCHGPNLAGGPIPGMPPEARPAANLTPTGIGSYSEADFTKILRQGVRPSGVPVDTLMPWKLAGQMTDGEIHAVWSFLKTVKPAEYGSR